MQSVSMHQWLHLVPLKDRRNRHLVVGLWGWQSTTAIANLTTTTVSINDRNSNNQMPQQHQSPTATASNDHDKQQSTTATATTAINNDATETATICDSTTFNNQPVTTATATITETATINDQNSNNQWPKQQQSMTETATINDRDCNDSINQWCNCDSHHARQHQPQQSTNNNCDSKISITCDSKINDHAARINQCTQVDYYFLDVASKEASNAAGWLFLGGRNIKEGNVANAAGNAEPNHQCCRFFCTRYVASEEASNATLIFCR